MKIGPCARLWGIREADVSVRIIKRVGMESKDKVIGPYKVVLDSLVRCLQYSVCFFSCRLMYNILQKLY